MQNTVWSVEPVCINIVDLHNDEKAANNSAGASRRNLDWWRASAPRALAVSVGGTHMLEGVVGHRCGSGLLQVVVPVKVRHILTRVSIWNIHTHTHIYLKKTRLSSPTRWPTSYLAGFMQRFAVLTRLQWLLTHAGAPSRPRPEALWRNSGFSS